MSVTLSLQAHLKELRKLYHQTESAISSHKIKTVNEELDRISCQINQLVKEKQIDPKNEEVQNIWCRVKIVYRQVEMQLNSKSLPAPTTPFSEEDLAIVKDQLATLRQLHHEIQKADSIETVEQEIEEELHSIEASITKYNAMRKSFTEFYEFRDYFNRLKRTLFEVKDYLQIRKAQSIYDALAREGFQILKLGQSEFLKSNGNIYTIIETSRQRKQGIISYSEETDILKGKISIQLKRLGAFLNPT